MSGTASPWVYPTECTLIPGCVPEGVQTVYEDADLLVLNKPSGLLCVPGRGADKQDCLSARAQARWPGALVVHRLDQATSGLVLMARHAGCASLGVSYGAHEPAEFDALGPLAVLHSVGELRQWLGEHA